MKELADRDIKTYVLPKREKELIVSSDGGNHYRFVLRRPCLRDRNTLTSKYDINKHGDKLGEDDAKLRKYMNDVIILLVKEAKKDDIDMVITQEAFDDWDADIYELLFSECITMMGLGEKDRYFRDKGDTPK